MQEPNTAAVPELGQAPSITYNHLFLKHDMTFCSEGVPIFPVVLQGSQNSQHEQHSVSRPLFLLFFAVSAFAQQNTISSIRVIGNRRIPKETILARLFTHPGDTIDQLA